ncbi:MAG: hypothetical protein A2015_15155 [Spirochaetes bacterium GWF1_31_7]|nr:MAG: hypothetical protein A2Y30_11580 [Spirochaetes bacterium GWE1_32_154]OHD51160.1 MAG: hypothetical protein A2Y29_01120 [Spirochaetes bacterium GWE2_31_10]OHD52079.1 MAG: hypothetical protein A2015_15155 [Spirochaetes bacterium GWF1_31_7]OHD80845.1 MAG: hypothetical protein A2355_14960 [Spirochaetes bacterium RIFOXYB1_FULL_32_8]HBD93254.1 two-component system response regulator [Spirochaetia bacterium]
MRNKNLDDLDFLLRESVNTIKGSIDQVFFGILEYLEDSEKQIFLDHLKKNSDSLQDVLYESIVERAKQLNILNDQLLETNSELVNLKDTLELKVIERTKEIKQIQDVTIFSLARLAESRDHETGEHLDRIRHFSYILADFLFKNAMYKDEINTKFIYNIYHTSPLHDIGKVGIRDSILLKPGKLTDSEFEEMKQHTIIGGKTLEDAEKQLNSNGTTFLLMGKKIAYFHHEKWDGSGYPYGLKNKDIPLSARIVAIADVYDALTSKRVYKPPFLHDDAKQIILDGSGTHFDPVLIDAFKELEKEFNDIREGQKITIPTIEKI